MAKKILLFSPPFSGHLNVLKNLIREYQNKFNFHLVITGWKNIAPDLKDITIPVTVLAHSDLHETDPALWTLPRTLELLDDCLKVAREEKPDLILYDFFSLEGNLVGKIIDTPYWASIPALMGSFDQQNYLRAKLEVLSNGSALNGLEQKFPGVLDKKTIEMISDGLHIPGQKNIIWSYPALTPKDFMTNRQPADYVFVGHLNTATVSGGAPITLPRPLVYFSFGTVVMNNLWNQQVEIRGRLRTFVGHLAELSKNQNYDILFVNQGKLILDSYPSNWRVVAYANQIEALSQASVFITHAGGNSFHEAVLKKVPMVAIPFFGDQPLVAHQIEALGLGVNLVSDEEIDTKKSKDFLNEALAEKTSATLANILEDATQYKHRFDQLQLDSVDLDNLLSSAQK